MLGGDKRRRHSNYARSLTAARDRLVTPPVVKTRHRCGLGRSGAGPAWSPDIRLSSPTMRQVTARIDLGVARVPWDTTAIVGSARSSTIREPASRDMRLAVPKWPRGSHTDYMTGIHDAYEFDLAVSFAGEDRALVKDVVDELKKDLRVFYDEDLQVESWGRDGIEYFSDVYFNKCKYVVMFVSAAYAKKMWTRTERRAALARAATEERVYLLPVRLDDTKLPGLLPTTLYLDSRKLGSAGIVEAVRVKVKDVPLAIEDLRGPIDRVPQGPAEIETLLAQRVGPWEYFLYAALLKANIDQLEPKYRDYKMQYARRSGVHVAKANLVSFSQSQIQAIESIVENFNFVLSPDVQQQAFGAPGEAGDADRIAHIAERFVNIYEEMLDWAAGLRGADAEVGKDALRTLALWIDDPIEKCRAFVEELVRELNRYPNLAAAGDALDLSLTLKAELSPELSDLFVRRISAALVDA